MNSRFYITALVLLLCCSVSAQTTAERAAKRAKQRAEYKAQNKADRSVDKAVDGAFDSIGNLFKKKKKTAPEAPAGQAPEPATAGAAANPYDESSVGEDSGPYEPFSNEFTVSMDMEVTQTKKNGKAETSSISMAITTDRYAVVIRDENGNQVSQMIFNTQDGKTTMITTDKNGVKTGFRMKLPGGKKIMENTVEDMADRFEFNRTGQRKNIDGYDCEEVIVKDLKEGTVTNSWITQDLGISSKDVFSGFVSALGKKVKTGPNSVMSQSFAGFPIMSTTEDKGKTYVTHFRNIKVGEANIDQSLLSTEGVQIQSLGF